jgi:hypothetical protein
METRIVPVSDLNAPQRLVLDRVYSACWNDLTFGRDTDGKWITVHSNIPCTCGVPTCSPQQLSPEMQMEYDSLMTAVNYIEHSSDMKLTLHYQDDIGLLDPAFEMLVDTRDPCMDQ